MPTANRRTRMTKNEWSCAMKRLVTWNAVCAVAAIIIYIFEKIPT